MADFSCAICLDTASEPVVTRCGHLFCWNCLDHWLRRPNGVPECPVCKGRVDERIPGDIIPLYGKGKANPNDTRPPPAPPSTVNRGGAAPSATGTATATASPSSSTPPLWSNTAYSYSYNSNSRSTNTTEPASASPPGGERPRPEAVRAPPPPRPPPAPRVQRRGGRRADMQFSMAPFGLFFFGLGGYGMWLSMLLMCVWVAYTFVPWDDVARRVLQLWSGSTPATSTGASGAASSASPSANDAAGPNRAEGTSAGGAEPPRSSSTPAPPPPRATATGASPQVPLPPGFVQPPNVEELTRNVFIGVIIVFLLLQMLLAVAI